MYEEMFYDRYSLEYQIVVIVIVVFFFFFFKHCQGQ